MTPDPTIAEADWAECEAIIKEFEVAWKSGSRPDISTFAPPDHPLRDRLLAELAHTDLELRLRAGEQARVEEYARRYSELDREQVILELVFAEYSLRARNPSPPDEAEYYARFPGLCDALSKLFAGSQSPSEASRWVLASGRTDEPSTVPIIQGCEVEVELGRGGMGVVYRARQPALNRVVAVKTITTAAPGSHDRFRKEAEAIARLDHPHIVPVYEVGEWRTCTGRVFPYFTMKWYPGGSLDAVQTGPGCDLATQAHIVETIAHAVHHAHERGVLHRDLKPSNVLLDERREPHVADFGLAGLFDPLTANSAARSAHRSSFATVLPRAVIDADHRTITATVFGTPSYMAPEQTSTPARSTTATDIYGLGAILYHLLTGRPPFKGETPLETLEQVASSDLIPPSTLNPAVDRDLEAICLKCLSRDPAKRYSSADALADDLVCWRTWRPVTARPRAAWELAWLSVRRHPAVSLLGVSTFTVLIAAVVILALGNSQIREKEASAQASLISESRMRSELETTLRREQQQLYLERVATTGRLYQANQLTKAWWLLDACPDHLRGWEWRYLDSRRRSPAVVLRGHNDWVGAVAVLPDGRIASGDNSGTIHLWDRDSFAIESTSLRVKGRVADLAVHPRQSWLAAATGECIQVFDAATGSRLQRLGGSLHVAFSPDGNLIAAPAGKILCIWSTSNWELLHELAGHRSPISALAFHPNGYVFAGSTDGSVRVWNPKSGKPVTQWEREGAVYRLEFASRGKTLLEARRSSLLMVDSATGDLRGEFSVSPSIRMALAAPPRGDLLFLSDLSGQIVVWDLLERRSVRTFRGHTHTVSALAVSPDGGRLLSCGGDRTVRVWESGSDPDMKTLASIGPWPGTLDVAKDGTRAAVSVRSQSGPVEAGTLILNAATGHEYFHLDTTGDVAFHPESRHVSACRGRGEVVVWDAITGAEVWSRSVPRSTYGGDPGAGIGGRVAFSPDGKRLATWQHHGRGILLWNSQDGSDSLYLETGDTYVTWMGFARDGRLAASTETGVFLWDSAGRRLNPHSPLLGLSAVAWSPNGEYLVADDADHNIQFCRPGTGEVIRTMIGSPIRLSCAVFDAAGTRLVTGSADGSVKVWDTESGQELLTLRSAPEPVRAVAWCESTDRIYALSSTVMSWDTQPARSPRH